MGDIFGKVVLSHLILPTILNGRYYYSHFTSDSKRLNNLPKKTAIQTQVHPSQITFPQAPSYKVSLKAPCSFKVWCCKESFGISEAVGPKKTSRKDKKS